MVASSIFQPWGMNTPNVRRAMAGDAMRQQRGMRPRRAAIAAIAVIALSACGDDGGPTLEAEPESTDSTTTTIAETTTAPVADPLGGFTPSPIEWEDCGRIECGTVEVPLDWSDVTGPTIDIAVARDPADDEDVPPGFLAYNLGGPGA